MSFTRMDDRSSGNPYCLSYFSHVLVHMRFSHLWRLVMVFLMTTTFVLGSWSTLVAHAQTMQISTITLPSASAVTSTVNSRKPPHQPKITHATPKTVSSSQPFDGLGDLPFYTYITYSIDDRVQMKVNVANGNLVVHTSDLHITGTGIDVGLEGYYNSQEGIFPTDHGNEWNFSFGHDVRLDLSNPTQGITFHGPSGYSAFFAYNPQNPSTYIDAPGLNATLVHNGDGTYTLTFHRTGEQLVFGTNSHLAADKDKNGNSISYSYNSSHDLLSLTDTQGRVTNFDHNTVSGFTDPSGQLIKVTDPSGRIIQYSYNERSNPTNSFTTLTDASGATTKFDYSGGDLISITDPLGNVTTITYLSGDKVGTITDATSTGTITFTYNSGNTVVTDRNGNNTTYTYNATEPNQFTVTKVTDALGHNQSNMFDANYNQIQYMDALSDTSIFKFNAGTNTLHSVADGNGATTSFGYPTPGSQNQFYPLNQTDPQGNQTDYAYDTNGNLKSATNHTTGKGLTYVYNSNGTIQSETDADGNKTSFGYDSKGNLTSVTPPAPLGAITLLVDGQTSRVTSVTDGNGNTTSYTYDALDRVKTISYQNGGTITYSYDADGNLLSLIDNTGTTTFKYDVLNRITKKTLPDGVIFTTGYDKMGNLTTFNDGSGVVTYQYDIANRMIKLIDINGSTTLYTYDDANRKTVIQYPNSTGMRMTYDKTGHELTSIGGKMDSNGNITTTYSSFTYSYLAGSAQTALVQTVTLLDPVNWQSGTLYTRNYTYDNQNRLTVVNVLNSSKIEVQKWTYGYDPNGNRTSYTQLAPAVSISYTYTGGNEIQKEVQGSTTTNFTFDGNGNLTGQTGGQSLAYNGKEQTKSIGSNSYTYSGPSQQDRVQINSTTLDYSGLGLSQQTDATGTTHFTRCSCGLLNNERLPTGKRYYYLFDGLGSIVGLTDSTSSKVNSYDYDAYGVMLNQTEGVTNPWKFASGYLDASGYYQFGVRYYDPSLGRWTQQDPVGGSLGDLNSGNRYTYAEDNPVNLVDPSGKSSTTDLLISCVVGGLVTLGGVFLAALAPVILATGPAGAVTLGAAVLAVLTGCILGELGYNLTQLFTGGF